MSKSREKSSDKLNSSELMKLNSQKELQIKRLKDIVVNKFDNSKNWSIMINPENNMVRNEVM